MKRLLIATFIFSLAIDANSYPIKNYKSEQNSYVSAMETCQSVLKEQLTNDPLLKTTQRGNTTYEKFNHQLVCTSGSDKPKSKKGYVKGTIYYQEIEKSIYQDETIKVPSDSKEVIFFATYPRYENYSIRELERELKR